MATLSEDTQKSLITRAPIGHSRKIRVLLIITQLALGGGTSVTLDIATHLKKHPDFDVDLITGPIDSGNIDLKHLAYEQGISTQIVPSLVNHINPIKNLKAVVDTRKIILQGNYDIVHTHTKVAGVVGRLAAYTAGTRVIIHHVHGWGSPRELSTGKRMLYLLMEGISARYTNRIITVCKLDIQKGISHHIGKKDKFTLIYNGIDVEKFRQCVDELQVRSELGINPGNKLVGMIARLNEQKNPLDFIRAAAIVAKNYSKVQFLIVGDGPLRSECEHLINELNLNDEIILLGYRNDVARILPTLTIAAMSSLWEGLPLAFMESMCAGKPIVANNVDGSNEVVVDGETGFLVTPHKPMEMAERILFLLNNEALCKKMGNAAQENSKHFSKQRMLENIELLYNKELQLVSHMMR